MPLCVKYQMLSVRVVCAEFVPLPLYSSLTVLQLRLKGKFKWIGW